MATEGSPDWWLVLCLCGLVMRAAGSPLSQWEVHRRGGQAQRGVLDGSNLSHSSCTAIALFSPPSCLRRDQLQP